MPKTASTIGRCLALLLFAGLALAAGLLEEQFISLWLVEPPSATDSEVVRARGYPHAWLVNEPQPPGVPELSRRIVNRQLLMSLFFWLAASTIALSALRAIWHRFSRRPRLSAPMGLRLFAAWSMAGCAATYGYLFTGMFSYWWLLIATVIGVTTPFVVVRSWETLRSAGLGLSSPSSSLHSRRVLISLFPPAPGPASWFFSSSVSTCSPQSQLRSCC